MRISDWSSDVCSSDLNARAAWQADRLRDEAVIAPLMTDGDWHWLRYPYLAEGETPDKWQAARRFLAGHGYRIASVTMSFGDYAWAAPYARCVAAQEIGRASCRERVCQYV